MALTRSFFSLRRNLLICLLCLPSFGLAGCMDPEEINQTLDTKSSEVDKALEEITPTNINPGTLVIDDRPWYGSKAVPLQNGDPLPAILSGDDGVVMTFERPVSLAEIGRMIQSSTGIRVLVNENSQTLPDAEAFIPVDGVEVAGGRIVWQGSLNDFLNQIIDFFDAEWEYVESILYIHQEVTKTFMLHALADEIDFVGDIANEGDDTGVVPQVSISSNATLSIWEEMQETIDNIINERGRVSYSPSTGTISVSALPSIVKSIEQYLKKQNNMRLRRVAVAVKVLNIDFDEQETVGVDLNGVLTDLFRDTPFQFSSIGGGLAAGILSPVAFLDPNPGVPEDLNIGGPVDVNGNAIARDDVAALLVANREENDGIERISIANSGAIVTLSDIPAPLQVGQTRAFAERVSAADGGVSIEPGSVSSGLTMSVLPRVIEEDRILLRLAIGLTNLIDIDTFASGGSSVQLPIVDTTGFLQNAVLSEGETLVLAGFERDRTSSSETGNPGGLLTGGERVLSDSRVATILLIKAEILPEDPFTVTKR